MRASLEESVSKLDENHNMLMSNLINECDHALAFVKVIKNEKVEFVAAHDRNLEVLVNLQGEQRTWRTIHKPSQVP